MTAKRCLCLVLVFCLALSLVPAAMATERAVASTLRLDAVEGTVAVRNRADKAVTDRKSVV